MEVEKDVYDKLIDWLVTTFRALPGVNTPEFREIVQLSYTPEEALLALQMGHEGGTLDELAAKTGMDKEYLNKNLESMVEKCTIYKEPGSDNPVYTALGVELPGLIEAVGWGNPDIPYNKKLLELWGKFKPIYINEGIAELEKHFMAWCMVSALPPDAKPEENLFEQMKKFDYIAVFPCPCRKIEKHTVNGNPCDCVLECCMFFGQIARWAVEQGKARQVNTEEVLDILKACEVKGQVHSGSPGVAFCNCCKHACINLGAQKIGKQHSFFQNHFFSVVDPKTCKSCGTCVKRCPVGAMQLDGVAVVNQSKCIGCGACATGCETTSIRMVRRPDEECARLNGELAKGFGKVVSRTKLDPLVIKTIKQTKTASK